MNLAKLNQWLTLVANFGVVGGLGLLALEINHASKLAETEAYVDRTKDIGDHFTLMALSTDLPVIRQKMLEVGVAGLTPVEHSRMFAWELARMYRIAGQYHQYEQGFLDKETIETAMALGAVRSAARWRELGIVIDNDAFRKHLEQMEAALDQ